MHAQTAAAAAAAAGLLGKGGHTRLELNKKTIHPALPVLVNFFARPRLTLPRLGALLVLTFLCRTARPEHSMWRCNPVCSSPM